MTAVVRALTAADEAAWRRLFRGYRDFYGMPHTDENIDTVWGWLQDERHETRGLVAEVDGAVVGIGNFRTFARPLSGSHGLWLDDLFTDPEVRGSGAGAAILQRLAEIARDEDATVVRWITAQDNEVARGLYDRDANQTAWVTYDKAPAQ